MEKNATLDDLVDQVGNLTSATTDLLNVTADGKLKLDEAVTSAETSANTATSEANRADSEADRSKTEADRAEAARTGAETAETNAEKAASDAAAIAYEGEASLEPAPGKLAIADSTGKFHPQWIPPVAIPEPDFHLPLVNDLHVKAGLGMPVTFTRDTKGTCLDKFTGTIAEIEKDQPRFENNGVLIEGSGTNLVLNSSKLDSIDGHTITTINDSVLGENALRINVRSMKTSTGQGLKITHQEVTNGTFAYSFYVQAETASYILINLRYNGDVRHDWFAVNLADGTVSDRQSNADAVKAKITPLGNGAYRITMERTLTDAQRYSTWWITPSDINGYPTADSDNTLLVKGFQIEPSPTPTSYIPTSGTAVTRTYDQLTFETGNLLNDEFTVFLSVKRLSDTLNQSQHIFTNISSVYKAGVKIRFSRASSIEGLSRGHDFSLPASEGINDLVIRQSRESLKCNNLSNGAEVVINAPPSITGPLATVTRLGSRTPDRECLFGHIRNLRIWNHALTDNQIYHLGGTQ